MKIAAHTLGCKLNSAETSTIVDQFRSRDWEITTNPSDANVYLLNTCSVTVNAERECRQIVRRILRSNPKAFIAVTGCYAQLRPEEIASIEGVDIVLGAKEKFSIFSTVEHFTKFDAPKIFSSPINEATDFHIASTAETSERTRAFLKVQDGCDYSCSFCTIPLARGASRSTQIEYILNEARRLCSDGFQEIVLSGVNVGDYGTKIGLSFFELVKAIESDTEINARIRISSVEPNLLSTDIINLIAASSKFCPHFHIPLQSGSDTILRAMQRRYTSSVYADRIRTIKQAIPHCGIGVDVIVGFPGETDEDFKTTYEFLNELDISYLHVFTYSERPDTKAAKLAARVPIEKRKERNAMLRILSEKKRHAFYRSQLGREATVLIEENASPSNQIEGFTEQYVRVSLPSNAIEQNAATVRVLLTEISDDIVTALPLEVLSYTSDSTLLPILR